MKAKLLIASAGFVLLAQTLAAQVTYRIYATREGLVGYTTANGHVITSRDHFVALPSRTALNCNGCRTYTVNLYNPANGRRVSGVPVWDVGPWNTHDNYWHVPREMWQDLPRGKPEAQAAYENGYNGGKDEFGRIPVLPNGIDLADGVFWDDLGMVNNGWIEVTYNWETPPSTTNPHINPCIARNADGRQEIFAVGKDGQMYHMYQTSPNAGWTGWLSLQGGLAQNCVPAVGQNLDGRLELFAVAGGAVWHTYQNSVNSSGSWATWSSLGGSLNGLTTLAVGRNADGRLEVFGVGTGGDLQHMYQVSPNSGWTGWSSLGGSWSGKACIRTGMNLDGRMEIFLIGSTGQMYHNYQSAPNGGWVGWSNFGGSFNQDSRFCVGRNSDGRLEVFTISTAGDLQHLYQTAPNGSWYGWPSLGGSWNQAAQPVCALSKDGRLEVFVIGSTGQFYQNYFNGSAWTGWGSLGGGFSQDIRPCIGTNQDGRLEIFTTAPTSDMVHAYQNAASSTSSWTAWPTLGGSWN